VDNALCTLQACLAPRGGAQGVAHVPGRPSSMTRGLVAWLSSFSLVAMAFWLSDRLGLNISLMRGSHYERGHIACVTFVTPRSRGITGVSCLCMPTPVQGCAPSLTQGAWRGSRPMGPFPEAPGPQDILRQGRRLPEERLHDRPMKHRKVPQGRGLLTAAVIDAVA
jgi:hypothetical protein